MSEITNGTFKSVFTEEEDFTKSKMPGEQGNFKEIMVQNWEVDRLLENLDVNKAMGADEVLGLPMKKECKDQLVQPICEIINNSIEEGKVPKEWEKKLI